MIKPEFWDDQKLCSISRDARLAFIGLWTNSDDYGVVKGHPVWLKSQIFPYDDIKLQTFQGWLNELERLKVIVGFNSNGESFYFIKNFEKHQVVNRKSQSRNPCPPDGLTEGSVSAHGGLSEDSMSAHGGLTDETETETEVKTETETHSPPSGGGGGGGGRNGFDAFWSAYPRRIGKLAALKAWQKLKTPATILPKILEAIARQRDSPQWTREGGRFVPHPATWLNQGRWEDEPETAKGRCPGFDEKGNVVWR